MAERVIPRKKAKRVRFLLPLMYSPSLNFTSSFCPRISLRANTNFPVLNLLYSSGNVKDFWLFF